MELSTKRFVDMTLKTRRIGSILKDLPTARVTLTDELKEIGIDLNAEQKIVVATYIDAQGKKLIMIEPEPSDA